MIFWTVEADGSFTATFRGYEAVVYWDDQDPTNEGYAYRIIGPNGFADSDSCDSLEEGKGLCEYFFDRILKGLNR